MQRELNDFVAHPAGESEAGALCSICQSAILAAESIGPCPSCASTFHGECWTENGGCAVYGCDRMPRTVKEENAAAALRVSEGLGFSISIETLLDHLGKASFPWARRLLEAAAK